MSNTAAINAGMTMMTRCLPRAPLTNSMMKMTAAAHTVMDILGSSINKRHTAPPKSRVTMTLENFCMSAFDAKSAIAMTIKNFAYSEG